MIYLPFDLPHKASVQAVASGKLDTLTHFERPACQIQPETSVFVLGYDKRMDLMTALVTTSLTMLMG